MPSSDEAQHVLNEFGTLFVKFNVKELRARYPKMTKPAQEFVERSKDEYGVCGLAFRDLQIFGTPSGGETAVLAKGVLVCTAKNKKASAPPEKLIPFTFRLRNVENRWEMMTWDIGLGGG